MRADGFKVIKSTANPDDGKSRMEFEFEITFQADDSASHAILLQRTELLLEKQGVAIYEETPKAR